MKPHEDIVRDHLWVVYRVKDSKVLNSIKKFLSVKEQRDVRRHPAIVTKEKLIVVAEHPEELKELIFITQGKPNVVYRTPLRLMDKQHAR